MKDRVIFSAALDYGLYFTTTKIETQDSAIPPFHSQHIGLLLTMFYQELRPHFKGNKQRTKESLDLLVSFYAQFERCRIPATWAVKQHCQDFFLNNVAKLYILCVLHEAAVDCKSPSLGLGADARSVIV